MRLSLRTKHGLLILSSILSVLILLVGAVILQTRSSIERIQASTSKAMEEALLNQSQSRAADIDKMKADLAAVSDEGARQNISSIAIIAVVLAVFGIIAAFAVAKNISDPIGLLSVLMKRVGDGEYNVSIPVGRSDELGELGNIFNKMAKDIRDTTFSRNFLNTILNSMVDPLIVADSARKIMMINKATCYLLGYKKEEDLIGQPIEMVFSKAVRESSGENRLLRLINQGIVYYETSFVSKQGHDLPVLVSGSSIKDDSGSVVWTVCTAVDISKRKKAEDDLRKAYTQLQDTQSQLIQAEKMDAIGRMASGVAHEVKNPLSVILQGVNCLEMRLTPSQKENHDILQKIKNNVERADNIIKSLLDFSKLTELKLMPEDLNNIVESALGLLHHRVKFEKIKVVKELGRDLPKISADKRKMEQVFVNILLNAIQAMPNGGNLTLRSYTMRLHEAKSEPVRNTAGYFEVGQRAVIAEIEDTGVGISEEDLSKIFEPFFTTKEPQEGTGLGLSVTRNIVDMHKGYLAVESEKNKGTKVSLYLPIK